MAIWRMQQLRHQVDIYIYMLVKGHSLVLLIPESAMEKNMLEQKVLKDFISRKFRYTHQENPFLAS